MGSLSADCPQGAELAHGHAGASRPLQGTHSAQHYARTIINFEIKKKKVPQRKNKALNRWTKGLFTAEATWQSDALSPPGLPPTTPSVPANAADLGLHIQRSERVNFKHGLTDNGGRLADKGLQSRTCHEHDNSITKRPAASSILIGKRLDPIRPREGPRTPASTVLSTIRHREHADITHLGTHPSSRQGGENSRALTAEASH